MRSQKQRVINGVNKAFRKLGDLVETGTIHLLNPAYDPAIGQPPDDDTDSPFEFVEWEEKAMEKMGMNSQVMRKTGFRVIVRKESMTVEPVTESQVTLRGKRWEFVELTPIFDAAYIFMLKDQQA